MTRSHRKTDKAADKKVVKPETAPGTTNAELATLAELAGEMVEAGQAAALGMFEAEVDELKGRARGKPECAAEHEARRREEDEEAEEGFDNMPV